MMQFHAASVVLLVVPLFLEMKIKVSPIWLVFAPSFSVVLYTSGLVAIMASETGGSVDYAKGAFSLLGLLLRVVLFFIVYEMYKPCVDKKTDLMFNVYYCGFLVYLVLFLASTLSQRLTVPLKSVEFLLIPILLYFNPAYLQRSIKSLKPKFDRLAMAIIMIMVVMFTKNLNSYISQGGYTEGTTIFNFPYVTVFNAQEIYRYREDVFWDTLED